MLRKQYILLYESRGNTFYRTKQVILFAYTRHVSTNFVSHFTDVSMYTENWVVKLAEEIEMQSLS